MNMAVKEQNAGNAVLPEPLQLTMAEVEQMIGELYMHKYAAERNLNQVSLMYTELQTQYKTLSTQIESLQAQLSKAIKGQPHEKT